MPANITMREVAIRAGVSAGTVSNALNKPHLVADSTIRRITSAIEDLGFVRNDNARQLKMGQSSTIGMVVLSLTNPFFAQLAEACSTSAEADGLAMVFGSSDQRPVREVRYLRLFEEQRVMGILLAPLHGISDRVREVRGRGVPVVVFGQTGHDDEFCSVSLDGTQGSYLAAIHLISKGRKKICYAGGPLYQLEDRWAGFRQAMTEHSDVEWSHIDTADQTERDGYQVGLNIVALPERERPDGICAANDLVALGILNALRAHPTLQVPRDISIVGYDDIDQAARANVPLTSIRQPIDDLAAQAVELLKTETSGAEPHQHRHVLLSPVLVERASSL